MISEHLKVFYIQDGTYDCPVVGNVVRQDIVAIRFIADGCRRVISKYSTKGKRMKTHNRVHHEEQQLPTQ